HQAHRPRVPGGRRPPGRRRRTGGGGRAVRHRGPPQRGEVVPRAAAGQGHFPGTLTMAVAQSGSAWIAWRSVGPTEEVEDPQTLLLIMGLSASSRMWWRLLPHVSRRHRAIVFDNRGTGDSDRVRGHLSMEVLA